MKPIWNVRQLGMLTLAAGLVAAAISPAAAQQLAKGYQKNGLQVRMAFREVVADAASSTVRVLADDETVALGLIVSEDGFVLTKASQLSGALACRLRDGREFDATVVGVHKENDLAMLRIEAADLPAARWSTREPGVGRWLATPGAGELPVSVGVVSVKARAIPAERGILGIAMADGESGPSVSQVFPNTGADDAGLEVGDTIVSVAGTVVESAKTLADSIQQFSPGDKVRLLVRRGEEEMQVEAVLSDEFSSLFSRGAMQNRMGGELSRRRVGFASALQHDGVLRPEDCGGPVVDLSGEVVGINIARAGRTETFALPASAVLPLIEDLKSGKLAPPSVEEQPAPPAVAEVRAIDG